MLYKYININYSYSVIKYFVIGLSLFADKNLKSTLLSIFDYLVMRFARIHHNESTKRYNLKQINHKYETAS